MRTFRALALLAILAALTSLLVPSLALAGTGNWPAGKQTYTFQDGVAPTAAYSGCADTYVEDSGTQAARKFNHGVSTQLRLASIVATNFEAIPLIKFTFLESDGVTGGVPANLVVTKAELWVYKDGFTGENPPTPEDRLVYLYRCMGGPWTEGTKNGVYGLANWDSASASVKWPGGNTVDAQDVTAKFWRTGVMGAGTTGIETDSSTTGANGFWGTDTLSASVYNAGGVASGDYGNIPATSTAAVYSKQYVTNATRNLGWLIFDVLHDVQLMNIGAIPNYGWILTNSTSALTVDQKFASAEATYKLRRPKLVIEGYIISAASAASVHGGISGGGSVIGVRH